MSVERAPAARAVPPRARWFPWRSPKFWVVQASIVAIVAAHMVTVRVATGQNLGGVPTPLSSSLMLFPVLYAAVTFGTAGAMATSVWGTALFGVHWAMLRGGSTPEHLWIEVVGMAVLAASGVVVGRHVERERESRARLERALERLEVTESRYRDLFDHQPSPVVLTDGRGVVVEVNSAAEHVLGPEAVGATLVELLGAGTHDLIGTDALRPVAGPEGHVRRYRVSAHRVEASAGAGLTQVVLVDVTEQQHRLELQRALTASCLAAQEEERVRLARELHDDPLQQLTYLVRLLDDARLTGSAAQLAREAHRIAAGVSVALRQVIRGLRPPVLDDLGLVPALRQLAAEVQDATGLPVEVHALGGTVRAAPEVELAAYRIVQEALSNVTKHAGARRATVDVDLGDELLLTVRDDGRGFVPRRRTSGFGLAGMQERALVAGGAVFVQSRVGDGTEVRLALPVHGRTVEAGPGKGPSALPIGQPAASRSERGR